MELTLAMLKLAAVGTLDRANANSFLVALNTYGPRYGLDKPHRFVAFAAQAMHESGEFRYDREIWGPTAAQKRYDTRKDLGNTPAVDGDGYKNRGRGPFQLTGGRNIRAFHAWCVAQGLNPPDFVSNPDLINTDPWEGLSAVWYWEVGNPDGQSLNRYADRGDNEMITRRVNGGLNGYDDRLLHYDRLGLVVAGFKPTDIRGFQQAARDAGHYTGTVDGTSGPRTRSAIHLWLAAMSSSTVAPAPVMAFAAVAPKQIDKPITQTTGLWERIAQMGGLGSIGGLAVFFQDWRVIVAIAGVLIVVSGLGIWQHKRIIDAVRELKGEA